MVELSIIIRLRYSSPRFHITPEVQSTLNDMAWQGCAYWGAALTMQEASPVKEGRRRTQAKQGKDGGDEEDQPPGEAA